jgi:hypothetical protein
MDEDDLKDVWGDIRRGCNRSVKSLTGDRMVVMMRRNKLCSMWPPDCMYWSYSTICNLQSANSVCTENWTKPSGYTRQATYQLRSRTKYKPITQSATGRVSPSKPQIYTPVSAFLELDVRDFDLVWLANRIRIWAALNRCQSVSQSPTVHCTNSDNTWTSVSLICYFLLHVCAIYFDYHQLVKMPVQRVNVLI